MYRLKDHLISMMTVTMADENSNESDEVVIDVNGFATTVTALKTAINKYSIWPKMLI